MTHYPEGRGEPYASTLGQLELTAKLDEPVRDTRGVEIALYSADENKRGTDPTPWDLRFIEEIGKDLGI